MKYEYQHINIDTVRKIVKDKGFYFMTAAELFDRNYVGPKLYIVTDDPNFTKKNPALADSVIMSMDEFAPLAEVINIYRRNEAREIDREYVSLENTEFQELQEDMTKHEDFSLLKSAIDALDELQRTRLVLHYFYCKTYSEIAAIQGVSARAVSYSVRLAEKKVKEYLCTSYK